MFNTRSEAETPPSSLAGELKDTPHGARKWSCLTVTLGDAVAAPMLLARAQGHIGESPASLSVRRAFLPVPGPLMLNN